jgi:hypothetical protein
LVGMALAILCMIVGPLLHRWWNAKSGAQGVESGVPLSNQSGVS